jgi:PAS domain S-box-containing protein
MIADVSSALIFAVLICYLVITLLSIVMLRCPSVHRRVKLTFVAFQLVLIAWGFGYLNSYAGIELDQKYFWLRVSLTAGTVLGPVWLFLALACTDRIQRVSSRRLFLLAAPAIVLAAGQLTNDRHSLFYILAPGTAGIGDLDLSVSLLYAIGAAVTYYYLGLGAFLHARFGLASTGRLRYLGLVTASAPIPPVLVALLADFQVPGVSFGATQLTVLLSSLVFVLVTLAFNFRLGDTVRMAFSQAVEQMGEAFVVADPDNRVISINAAFANMLHLKRSEIVGRHINDVTAGLWDRIANLHQLEAAMSVMRTDPWTSFSSDIVVKDTPDRTYSLRLWPIRGKDGALAGRVATMRDITEVCAARQKLIALTAALQEASDEMEKRVEERTAELVKSERRFRLLAENIREVFWIGINRGEKIAYVSPMYEEVFGRSCDSLRERPRSWLEAVHPDDRQRMLAQLSQPEAARDQEEVPGIMEYRILRPDRTIRWIRTRIFPFRDEAEAVSGITGVAEDVTEEKQAQIERDRLSAAVAEERATLAAVMASMSDGLIVLDPTRRVRYCNARAGELLCADPATAIGLNAIHILAGLAPSEGNRTMGPADWEKLLTSPQDHPRLEIAVAGPSRRDLAIDLFPVMAAAGPELKTGMILRDLTSSRQLTLLEERERIAMDLHDGVIQSLYAVALGLAAQERTLDESAAKTRDGLRQARGQLSGVIQEIRNYIFDLRLQKLGEQGLGAGLEALAEELRVNALIMPELVFDANVDNLLSPDVVENVLHIVREATSNVIRHAGASQVRISLARAESHLVLSIRDNGRGFDRQDSQPRANGSGNGLRNMAERARTLGGHLKTASQLGHGTEVLLELPLSREALQERVMN